MKLQLPGPDALELLESPDPIERFRAATHIAERLDGVLREIHLLRASAAAELSADGHSYRDIGELFGLSGQRVGQMVGQVEGVSQLIRAWSELERKLRQLGLEAGAGYSTPIRKVLTTLRERGILDDGEVDDLYAIWTSRSEGVHTGRIPSDSEVEELLDRAIAYSAILENKLASVPPSDVQEKSDERQAAERLMRRVSADHPSTSWIPGRCEECGRAIPVPDGGDLWVCSQRCLEIWKAKLYSVIDQGSQEEAITRTPSVVPYWL